MPEPSTDIGALVLMRRVALAMLGLGSVVCAAGALLKDLTPTASAVQLGAAAGCAIAWAVVAAMVPHRRVLAAAAMLSICLLCAIVATSNEVGLTTYFLLWPLVYLAYFSSARVTLAAFGLMTVAVGVATVVNPYLDDRSDTFVGTVSSVGLMAMLVVFMNRREATLRDKLADAANTDALTGLLNRRGFGPELERMLDAGGPFSVVVFDLDHFKAFNDAHGHLGGDRALVRVADTLLAGARAEDRAARLGGEEFAVALADTDGDADVAYAQRVIELLRGADVPADERMTTSAGVATRDDDVATGEALLRCADVALYDAKAAGRDRCARWGDGLRPVPG